MKAWKSVVGTGCALAFLSMAPTSWALRGRALLIDAPDRTTAGNLILCTVKPGRDLTVVKATYGVLGTEQAVDVTDKIRSMATADGLRARVHPRDLGVGDPAKGKRKELKVEYTLNGHPQEQTMGDGGTLVVDFFERSFETLVEGGVVDARFSPDGKSMVFGIDKTIRVMDLQTRAVRKVGTFEADFTYFTWGTGNKIYWSDGDKLREIFRLDLATGETTSIHKGNSGRSTVSADGKKAAWVLPPVAAFIGGKQFRYQGGCGGAVSPNGRYLSSNLTTSHRLLGILEFGADGPSDQLVATVPAPENFAFNGFHFGRSDEWVCYVTEAPKELSPISFITYWPSGDHIHMASKLVIKDFFDDTDVVPADATLEKISVCAPGPMNLPLKHLWVNAGRSSPLKVVGHFRSEAGLFFPRLKEGLQWQADANKVSVSADALSGVAPADRHTIAVSYRGQRAAFDVTVLPELTGAGFKAEYFADAHFESNVLTRIEPQLDYRWAGRDSPDPAIDGRRPWSAQWSGMLEIQVEGEYTFYFLQGEGNDRQIENQAGEKESAYGVWLNGKLILSNQGRWNHPWARPLASKPVTLKKGRYPIRVRTVDVSAHPVVVRLSWSGPGIKKQLLGQPHVHAENP